MDNTITKGPLSRTILTLGLPMIFEMLLESILVVADIFFAACLGAEATATVALTESSLSVFYTLTLGLGMGLTALIARQVGQGDKNAAAISVVQVLIIGVLTGLFMTVMGLTYSTQLLQFVGGSPHLVESGSRYLRIIYGGSMFLQVLSLGRFVFRGIGSGRHAANALLITNLINLVLCPCLAFGYAFFPKLGVEGIGWATSLSRLAGTIYVIRYLFWPDGPLQLLKSHIRLNTVLMRQILNVASKGIFQMISGSVSWMVLIKIASQFGDNATAGLALAMRIIMFVVFAAFGLSNAAATMVGQLLGSNDPDRAEKAVWLTCFYNSCFLGSIGFVIALAAPFIINLFAVDSVTASYAVDCLRIVGPGLVFHAFGLVITQALNGSGDTWTPAVINFFVFIVLEIPLTYFLVSYTSLGIRSVFIAVLVAFITIPVLVTLQFRRGTWRLQKLETAIAS